MEPNQESHSVRFTLSRARDRVFLNSPYPKHFEFSQEVAAVFDDMALRSIPLYCELIELCVDWARRFAEAGSTILDVGCSTGTTLEAVAHGVQKKVHFIGIDASEPMLRQARQKFQPFDQSISSEFRQADASDDLQLSNVSVAFLNFTLQFLPVQKRLGVLRNLRQSLRSDGVLLISEKIRSTDPRIHEAKTSIYEEFKERQGYSRSEIERKKEALDQVLISYTDEQLCSLLKEAGFSAVEPVLRWNNFGSYVALP